MAQALPGSTFTVQTDDSLFSIAQQADGDGNKWQYIYDANKQVIGDDPNLIRPGEVHYIPQITPPQPKTCKVRAGALLLDGWDRPPKWVSCEAISRFEMKGAIHAATTVRSLWYVRARRNSSNVLLV